MDGSGDVTRRVGSPRIGGMLFPFRAADRIAPDAGPAALTVVDSRLSPGKAAVPRRGDRHFFGDHPSNGAVEGRSVLVYPGQCVRYIRINKESQHKSAHHPQAEQQKGRAAQIVK